MKHLRFRVLNYKITPSNRNEQDMWHRLVQMSYEINYKRTLHDVQKNNHLAGNIKPRMTMVFPFEGAFFVAFFVVK